MLSRREKDIIREMSEKERVAQSKLLCANGIHNTEFIGAMHPYVLVICISCKQKYKRRILSLMKQSEHPNIYYSKDYSCCECVLEHGENRMVLYPGAYVLRMGSIMTSICVEHLYKLYQRDVSAWVREYVGDIFDSKNS